MIIIVISNFDFFEECVAMYKVSPNLYWNDSKKKIAYTLCVA